MIDQRELQAALQKVFQRAATDDQFRQKCLTDPIATVREASGFTPPPGFRFRFVEKPVEALFLLPPLQGAAGELNDQALDGAAGGVTVTNYNGGGTP
jgi:hypothetical protein